MPPETFFPGVVPTLNAEVEVKDPAAAANSLYADYLPLPGPSGFTMPANPRTATEIVQLTGTAKTAGVPDPGEIAVSFAALHRSNPAMTLIYSKQTTSDYLLWRFSTKPIVIGTVAAAFMVVAGALNELVIAGGKEAEVAQLVAEGMVVKVGAVLHAIAKITTNATGGVTALTVSPVLAVQAAATALSLYVPGERHEGVRAQVLSVSKGDVQANSGVSGEMTLSCATVLGAPTLYT